MTISRVDQARIAEEIIDRITEFTRRISMPSQSAGIRAMRSRNGSPTPYKISSRTRWTPDASARTGTRASRRTYD
jgi:hypothetical protein